MAFSLTPPHDSISTKSETPADAIRCFLKNDIDYLVVENYLITPIRD